MSDPTRHVARAAIASASLAAFAGIWVLAAVITDGNPLTWYLSGGVAVHLLLVLALLQAVAGTWLGFRQLDAPLPTSLHFAIPIAAVLSGIGASTLGVNRAFDALASAPADLKLQTLTAGLAAEEVPRQLGALIGGLGCVSILVTAGIVAYLNREPARRRPGALLIAGLGTGAGTVVATLFLLQPAQDIDRTLVSWLTALVIGSSVLLATTARGAADLVEHREPAAPAAGFSMVVLAAVAAVGAVTLQGLATTAHGRIEALQATGMAPLDMAPILIAAGAATARTGSCLTAAFAGAIAVPATALVIYTRAGLRPWFRHRLLWAVLSILMVGGVAVVTTRFHSELEARVEIAAAQLRPHTPEGLALAGSTTEARYVNGASQVVILRGATTSVPERTVGPTDDPSTFEQLTALLQPPSNTNRTAADDLAAHLVTASAIVPPDCPDPVLEPFALVVDGTTPAQEILRFVAALRARGACRMRLMVRPRALLESPDLLAQRDAMRRELEGSRMLASLFDASVNDWHFIFAYLTAEVPRATELETPIILHVEDEAVRVVVPGTPDRVVAPTRRGRIDRDALTLELEDLKVAFPEERRVYVTHVGGASLQDVIDVLDAAREEVEFEDDTIASLDKVVLVTGPPPPDTEPSVAPSPEDGP